MKVVERPNQSPDLKCFERIRSRQDMQENLQSIFTQNFRTFQSKTEGQLCKMPIGRGKKRIAKKGIAAPEAKYLLTFCKDECYIY